MYISVNVIVIYVITAIWLSRNARGNENGRFDKISSNRANVHGFGDFGKF